jgi:hypothetical protein
MFTPQSGARRDGRCSRATLSLANASEWVRFSDIPGCEAEWDVGVAWNKLPSRP